MMSYEQRQCALKGKEMQKFDLAELREQARDYAECIYALWPPEEEHAFKTLWDALPAFQISRLDEVFRRAQRTAKYQAYASSIRWNLFIKRTTPSNRTLNRLNKNPRMASFLAHSHDGYVREQAVRQIDLTTPAAKAVLLLRCNDWVAEVREAAHKRLQDSLQGWTQDDLAPLVLFLNDKEEQWQRGGAEAASLISTHPEWNRAVLATLCQETDGPLAKLLRRLLRRANFDNALSVLAQMARSTHVRSIAYQTALEGCARWRVGTEWQWVDKTISLRRKIPIWETRSITLPPAEVEKLLQSAVTDRSSNVRKLAADHLIRIGPSGHEHLVQRLQKDKSRSVLERMEFFERKWLVQRA